MPLHCSCYIIASFLFHCYLWAYGLGFNGQNSCYANPLSTSLPLLGFIGPHSCRASPFHSSSTQLLLFYLFYAHGLSLNPLGFLGLTTTSLPLISFQAYWPLSNPMNLLTYFLGFPDPLTSSLPLIIVMGLILHSLGFLNPFASSLSLIIFAGLLTIIPTIPAYWALLYYFLFPLFFILLGFFYH